MKLKDASIKAFEPGNKVVKHSDGASLFLLVHPSGTKTWIYAYRFGGKQKKLTLGQYPQMSLKEARNARQGVRNLLDRGIDPGQKKHDECRAKFTTFVMVAEDWFSLFREDRAEKTISIYRNVLDAHLLPVIGPLPIEEIKRIQLVQLVKDNTHFKASKDRAKHRGQIAVSTALKMCYCLGMVFKHALNVGLIEYSVAAQLSSVLPDPEYSNQNTMIKPEEVKALLQAIRAPGYSNRSVWYFLNIMPYVFVRNTELRLATWEEFDLDAAEWYIPAARMKGKKIEKHGKPAHFVPLARQVVKLLRELKDGSNSEYLFPAAYRKERCITDAAPLVALKRFEFRQTIHGFRTIASTYLHELNFSSQVIEAQMAHKDDNQVRATYNKAEYKDERIKMMQEWADYLDALVELK